LVTQALTRTLTLVPTLNITLTLPQDEIDEIRAAAGSESVASLTVQALRRELRLRSAVAYAAWNESLPGDVRADLDAWDTAPAPGWTT
jgi:hypothetical protein